MHEDIQNRAVQDEGRRVNKASRLLSATIHDLHKQYPVDGEHTWSACKNCGSPSRGGTCADCLVQEMIEITGDKYLPVRYVSLLELQVELLKSMYEKIGDLHETRP